MRLCHLFGAVWLVVVSRSGSPSFRAVALVNGSSAVWLSLSGKFPFQCSALV
ncbi:O-methyltransferase [Sesbania bispinosa]|nr:O-methyltransferase [Sesbania bispinosa]